MIDLNLFQQNIYEKTMFVFRLNAHIYFFFIDDTCDNRFIRDRENSTAHRIYGKK